MTIKESLQANVNANGGTGAIYSWANGALYVAFPTDDQSRMTDPNGDFQQLIAQYGRYAKCEMVRPE